MLRLWWLLALTACVSEPDADPVPDQQVLDASADAGADAAPSACVEDETCARCVDGFCVERCPPACPNGVDTCEVTVGDCALCAFRSLQRAIDTLPVNSVIEICPGVHAAADVVYDGPPTETPTLTVRAVDAVAGYTLDAGGAARVLTLRGGEMRLSDATLTNSTEHAVVIEPEGRLDLNNAMIANVTSDRAGAAVLNQGWFGLDTVTIDNARCASDVPVGCALHASNSSTLGDRLTVQTSTSGLLFEARSFAQIFGAQILDNEASAAPATPAVLGSAIHVRESEALFDEPTIRGNGRSADGPLHAADIVAERGQVLIVNATVAGGAYQGTGDCSLANVYVVGERPDHLPNRSISIQGASTLELGTLTGCAPTARTAEVQLDAAAAMAWPVDIGTLPAEPTVLRTMPVGVSPPYHCPPGMPCVAGECAEQCAVGMRCEMPGQCVTDDCGSYGGVGVCVP